jgi:hypothetical protein
MELGKEWWVSWWRGPLPRGPLSEEPDPPGWEVFLPERFGTEHEAVAFATTKLQAGFRLEIKGPSGEKLEMPEIRRRLSS